MKQTPKKRPKAIITGIDKMVSYTGSWFQFLQNAGVDTSVHEKVYFDLRSGKINFEEAKKKLLPDLENGSKKIHKTELESVFSKIEINGDAYSTINDLKKQGFTVCIISGSIDLIVQPIAKKLGIKNWYANTKLIFDKDDYWIDMKYEQEEEELKLKQAKDFLKKNNLKKDECIVFGHSPTDIKLFEEFCGITIDSKYEPLKEIACQNVKFFPRVLQFLRSV